MFDPLSERMVSVTPLLAGNLVMAMRRLELSREASTSRCTTLTAIQIDMQPHLFPLLLPTFTVKGPKQSIPVD